MSITNINEAKNTSPTTRADQSDPTQPDYLLRHLTQMSYEDLKHEFGCRLDDLFTNLNSKVLARVLLSQDVRKLLNSKGVEDDYLKDLVYLQLLYDLLSTADYSAKNLKG